MLRERNASVTLNKRNASVALNKQESSKMISLSHYGKWSIG